MVAPLAPDSDLDAATLDSSGPITPVTSIAADRLAAAIARSVEGNVFAARLDQGRPIPRSTC